MAVNHRLYCLLPKPLRDRTGQKMPLRDTKWWQHWWQYFGALV